MTQKNSQFCFKRYAQSILRYAEKNVDILKHFREVLWMSVYGYHRTSTKEENLF